MNHRSFTNAQAMDKVSVVLPDDDIGSPQRSNSVESPGGSTRKGFGLKKWRRIKRDTPVKDDAAPADDDGAKLLKRGLTGLVSPPCKHVDLSSVEARQSSEGSAGSVNMAVQHHLLSGVVNGFSPVSGFMFNVGQGFDKSEEHSSKPIGGGKIVSGSQGRDTIKNRSGEQERKPCSRLDSDMRSRDFVFSSGDERLMMNHIAEGQAREQVQTYKRSESRGKDEDGDESKKNNNHFWADKDQTADSITSLGALQEALSKEVTSFQELSKESIPLHSSIDEAYSSEKPRNESYREENSTSSGSQVLILKQKVKHLQQKLEEARADLDAKEARIQELENSKIESELEDIFQRKIEAEIEHLFSLNSSLQVLKEQPKKVHSVIEDPEQNRGNILGKRCKSCFYFLARLILIIYIRRLLLLYSSPASQLVIPT